MPLTIHGLVCISLVSGSMDVGVHCVGAISLRIPKAVQMPPWHQTTTCLHDPVHSWKVHTSTSKDQEAFWQCHRASAQELHPGLLCLCTTRRQHARLKRPRRSQQRSNQNSKLLESLAAAQVRALHELLENQHSLCQTLPAMQLHDGRTRFQPWASEKLQAGNSVWRRAQSVDNTILHSYPQQPGSARLKLLAQQKNRNNKHFNMHPFPKTILFVWKEDSLEQTRCFCIPSRFEWL